jgi:hypothetical protein
MEAERQLAKTLLDTTRRIQQEVPKRGRPRDDGARPDTEQVLPHSLFRNTRDYIERIVFQINGTYEHGWFDACAVMIRRLVETLIIETFEAQGAAQKIKNLNGDFLHLADLVNATLAEGSWNLSRNTKQALKDLKDVGDKSAHSRRFVAHRWDIDSLRSGLRVATQELIALAGLQRR